MTAPASNRARAYYELVQTARRCGVRETHIEQVIGQFLHRDEDGRLQVRENPPVDVLRGRLLDDLVTLDDDPAEAA